MRKSQETFTNSTRWLTTEETAALLKVAPQSLRKWRVWDRRNGRGWPEAGYAGLRWKYFGPRVVRYDADSILLRAEQPESEGRQA
jgi:hypothetical protein